MTVKYRRPKNEPNRFMTAGDLGLDLLIGEYDPILLAAGIQAPCLTKKQVKAQRLASGSTAYRYYQTPEERRQHLEILNAGRRFSRTVAGKNAKQELWGLIRRYVRLGEVKR